MEKNAIQQEILLVKNSSLCRRPLFERELTEKPKYQNQDEQLEMACWNGWLNIMLPEIVDTAVSGKQLFLWDIMQSNSFLGIELCEYPQKPDVYYSINPYAVLTTMCYE